MSMLVPHRITTLESLRCNRSGSFETFAVKPFIHPCRHHLSRWRRSRPFQRGATEEHRARSERFYLAAVIPLWLRRAEQHRF